jgi:hypothetical protein
VQLATGAVTVTDRTYLGDPGYIEHTRATFTLDTPFVAQAGVHYWFGLSQYGVSDGYNWTVRDFAPSETSIRLYNDVPGYWRRFDYDRAFTLTGTAVPEPQTWSLMLLGFLGVGWAARRRLAPAEAGAAAS